MVNVFNGDDGFGGRGAYWSDAGPRALAVEQNGSCAAFAFAAAVLGASQTEVVAENAKERAAGVRVDLPADSVYCDLANPGHHPAPFLLRSRCLADVRHKKPRISLDPLCEIPCGLLTHASQQAGTRSQRIGLIDIA